MQNFKTLLHTKHAATTHTAIGAVLVLVALDGQTLTNDNESMDYGFFTDEQEPTSKGDSENAKGAFPFLVVKVKQSVRIWSMPVQCTSVADEAANNVTVESLSRLGSNNAPCMFPFRDAVIRQLKERLGDRAIAQAPTKIRFCVGWHGGERNQIGRG